MKRLSFSLLFLCLFSLGIGSGEADWLFPGARPLLAAPAPAPAVLTPLSNIQQVATGYAHTCALTTAGAVLCWGDNSWGQLGDSTTTAKLTPVAVSGLSSGVQAIAAGGYHTCALTTAGNILCWGYNGFGQLGDGMTIDSNTPVAVSGLSGGGQALTAGEYHTCALTTAGDVLCWGRNANGQLGDGTTTDSSTPVAVSGLSGGSQAIAAGAYHTCALTTDGGLLCWGWNLYGQLGDGTTTDSVTPVAVSGLSSGVQAIAAGQGLYGHTCALTAAGAVLCWGRNITGQLGDGTTTDSSMPVAVNGLSSGVQAIAAGGYHTCALTTDGGLLCWGDNFNGQLGDGTSTNSSTPVAVSGLSSDVQAIAAGGFHTCALTTDGGIRCWGWNFYGQLGNGTADNSPVPVTVVVETTGQAGNCNGDELINAGDLTATVLEIFDGDGGLPGDAPGGSFAGTADCDANEDLNIDAGDISCLVLLIFNGSGACTPPAVMRDSAAATLTLNPAIPAATEQTVQVPLTLSSNGTAVTAAAFSLRYDPSRLSVDLTDANGDNLPDAITVAQPGRQATVQVDTQTGIIKVFVADVTVAATPFADGTLATVTFGMADEMDATDIADAITFSTDVPVSLGNRTGQSVPVTTQVVSQPIMYLYLPFVQGE